MIKVDWDSYIKNHIWFGYYWLPGIKTMSEPVNPKGHWYSSPALRFWHIRKPRTFINMGIHPTA